MLAKPTATLPAAAAMPSPYFVLAKKHDEFDYLAREKFFIAVDSKEDFDSNYSSNWYYYFR